MTIYTTTRKASSNLNGIALAIPFFKPKKLNMETLNEMRGQLENPNIALDFIRGGNSTFTFVGAKNRFTYKVRKAEFDDTKFFVLLLNGSDNESNYIYMGMLFPNANGIKTTKGSKVGEDAKSFIAFNYVFKHLVRGIIPNGVSIYHEGRCGRCGRKLTVPQSIESGFGEKCLSLLGL